MFDKTPRILIVGAGASGISAATRLLHHGFENVTLLEAQNRFGGRISTIPFGDSFIDLGAEWCHGQENNAVFELVKDKDLLQHSEPWDESYKLVRSNGEIVDDYTSKKLKGIFEKIQENKKDHLKNYNDSLGTYNKEYFLKALEEDIYATIDRDIAMEFLELFQKEIASAEGCKDVYDVSGKGNLQFKEAPGDQNMDWKGKGYVTVLNILMETGCRDLGILHKRILFNNEVTNIKLTNSGVHVTSSNGLTFDADHVIFTASVGVIREKMDSLFDPKLPEHKYVAAKNLGFGTVNKIFLRFSEPWWDKSVNGFSFQWTKDDLEELKGTENFWLTDVFGFFTVSHQPNLLSGWVVGEGALHIETLERADQLKGAMYLLNRFLKGVNIPQPIDFIVTSWYSNKFARGSYSHRSMNTEAFNTSAADLAAPIYSEDNKPILLFAGEATHSFHYSTVHGAIESGWREADRIYEYYCK